MLTKCGIIVMPLESNSLVPRLSAEHVNGTTFTKGRSHQAGATYAGDKSGHRRQYRRVTPRSPVELPCVADEGTSTSADRFVEVSSQIGSKAILVSSTREHTVISRLVVSILPAAALLAWPSHYCIPTAAPASFFLFFLVRK